MKQQNVTFVLSQVFVQAGAHSFIPFNYLHWQDKFLTTQALLVKV